MTQSLKLASDNESKLMEKLHDLIEMEDRAVIDSDETMQKATDLAKFMKTGLDQLEEDRTGLTKPLNDVLKNINARYKKIKGPAETALASLKGKMAKYLQEKQKAEEEARQAAEQAALEEAAELEEQGQSEQAEQVLQEQATMPSTEKKGPVRGDFGGRASTTEKWTFEVEDILALAKARPDLIQVDTVAINKLIRGKDGVRDIPGLRIFAEKNIRIS